MSRTDLARRLGVQAHQIDYLVRSGRIPPGEKGDKFRSYTEEQADRITEWFEAYRELDKGVQVMTAAGQEEDGGSPTPPAKRRSPSVCAMGFIGTKTYRAMYPYEEYSPPRTTKSSPEEETEDQGVLLRCRTPQPL